MTARTHHDGHDDADNDAPSASPLFRTQAEFAAAICRGETRALRELFLAYAPLLRDQAHKLGVPPHFRDELVITVLDDVVMHLSRAPAPPRVLGRYIVACMRNGIRNWKRGEARRASRMQVVEREATLGDYHSSYAVRVANPDDEHDLAMLQSAVAKLASYTVQQLTDVELHMTVGLTRRIPIRELAEQLGMAYGTARVRMTRLRE